MGCVPFSVAKVDMMAGCIRIPTRCWGFIAISCSAVPVTPAAPKSEAVFESTNALVPDKRAVRPPLSDHSAASTCASNDARMLVCMAGV